MYHHFDVPWRQSCPSGLPCSGDLEANGECDVHTEAAVGWLLGFLRLLFRSPTGGSRVEEEAGFSFYLFCGLYIGYVFHCVILCRSFALTGKTLSTLYSIIKFWMYIQKPGPCSFFYSLIWLCLCVISLLEGSYEKRYLEGAFYSSPLCKGTGGQSQNKDDWSWQLLTQMTPRSPP